MSATQSPEFNDRLAESLRIFRQSRGYKSAASFARAIGYPPTKYRRYEVLGITQGRTLERFIDAVRNSGVGHLSIDWLLTGDATEQPASVRGAKVTVFLGADKRAAERRAATTSELSPPQFPTGFPYQLSQEATEALTDPKQRQIFGRLLRAHRGLLAMQRRHVAEKIQRLDQEIAKCDQLIAPLDPDISADI